MGSLLVGSRQKSVDLARLRSKSAALSSCSSIESRSSSQSAQVTERFTIKRKALTCCGVHSSQRMTGTSVMPSLRAAFRRRWPSTTSPSLRASTGILKTELADAGAHSVNDGMVLARIAGVEDQAVDGPDLDLKRGGRDHYAPWIAIRDFGRQQTALAESRARPFVGFSGRICRVVS